MEDFDGWEVLPDEGYLQVHDDGGKRIYSRSYGPGSRCVYKDYFICPDSTSTQFVENTQQQQQQQQKEESEQQEEYPSSRSRLVSIQSGDLDQQQQQDLRIISEAPFDKTIINQSPPPPPPLLLMIENLKEKEDPDPDPVLQVMYKKMMDPEFVDMKKIESSPVARSMKPPPFPLDDQVKGEIFDIKKISSPNSMIKLEEENMIITHHSSSGKGGGFNIWKWSLTTGIGAICSFGIATATVCIIFFGTHHRDTTKQQEQHQSKEKRKLHFHIYSDEKKQKEARSGKGHVTVGGGGGYYDQLFE